MRKDTAHEPFSFPGKLLQTSLQSSLIPYKQKAYLKKKKKNTLEYIRFSGPRDRVIFGNKKKIVIGLCSIAAVIGLGLGMEYEQGQPTGSNSFLS